MSEEFECPKCGAKLKLVEGDAFSGFFECPNGCYADEKEFDSDARRRFEREREAVHSFFEKERLKKKLEKSSVKGANRNANCT